MEFNIDRLRILINSSEKEAWKSIVHDVIEICKAPLNLESVHNEIKKRDQKVGEYDNFLTSCAWEFWKRFEATVEKNSRKVLEWWNSSDSAKAVLILDGLSLRELPWLLEGAGKYGFNVEKLNAYAAEIPGDTVSFAKAIGLSSRSQLQNNGAKSHAQFKDCATESVDFPWIDCIKLIGTSKNYFFWHHWPDCSLHDESVSGQGLRPFTKGAMMQLTSDEFWKFAERLAQGRKLLITSDHGYAATGNFVDANDEQAAFLKRNLKRGRLIKNSFESAHFSPPIALPISNEHGDHLLAIGRRKWKVSGGYPTLAHGGMSILELLSPHLELSK